MSHLNAEFLLPPGLCLGVLLGGEGLAQQRLLKLLAQAAPECEQLRAVVPEDRQNDSNLMQTVLHIQLDCFIRTERKPGRAMSSSDIICEWP